MSIYCRLRLKQSGATGWISCALVSAAWGLSGLAGISTVEAQQAFSFDQTLTRFTEELKYLASDELGGRQPGTPQMEKAVEFIVKAYQDAGLKPAMPDGTYLQPMDVGRSSKVVADKTSLKWQVGDKTFDLKLDEQFTCQQGDNVDVEGELVFVGYGVSAEQHNFDEYAGIDVAGKIVVLVRMKPQQSDPNSVFSQEESAQLGSIRTKCRKAQSAGAKAVIMVNDRQTAPNAESDTLAPSDLFGASTAGIPFFHVKRSVLDQILELQPLVEPTGKKIKSVAEAEEWIDKNLESLSQPLANATVKGTAAFEQVPIVTHNIVGIIEGEGPHADETIVIGAHYDHLGKGAYGSRVGPGQIHNGADDNATGTVGVMELARRFQARGTKPARRLVFICFTAEEMGLLGAQHYVQNPIFPLENTVAMLNYDMIGWLRDNKLTIYSWDSSPEFAKLIDDANVDTKFELVKPVGGFAGSDHLPFQQMRIPVMFLHTGLTPVYHTPDDDFESINCEGAVRVIEYTEKVIDGLLAMETRPTFAGPTAGRRSTVRLGAALEDGENEAVKVVDVEADSLAAKSGIQVGDLIRKVAGKDIKRRREVVRELNANSGKSVELVLERDGKLVTMIVEIK